MQKSMPKEVYEVQLDAVNKSAGQQQLLEQLDEFQSIRDQFVSRTRLAPQKSRFSTSTPNLRWSLKNLSRAL